jgi:hypothetical protein
MDERNFKKMNTFGLEKPFGLKGKKVLMKKGPYKGKGGVILEETGYTDAHGVVAKIQLNNGIIREWSSDFWEELEEY